MILLYTFFVLCSCIYSWYFNGQELYLVIVHSYYYFGILFFFYLLKSKLSASEAEKALIIMSITCCCCYILQWLIYPTILFYGADSESKTLFTYRVRIPGSIGCYCLLLYGINRYLLQKHFKYLFYTLLGGLPILIMGFRSLNTLSLLSIFVMIPFVLHKIPKTMFYSLLGVISILLLMQTPIVKLKLAEMEERNETGQSFENEDYVRFREFDYYWNEQFANPVEKFFGGGVPTDPESKYDKDIHGWAYSNGLYWDDLGLVGLSMIIGMPAVALLLIMYVVCIWRCKDSHLQYIRFTLLIVLLGSLFTTAELFRQGNILLLSLFLYIEYKYHQERVKNIAS
ncbi:MAG: hypothetical protein IJ901_03065 [Bacteroidaceae bacterium]|nr:hypothetical protein [Bacteroidaceae bacterium]